MLSNIFRSYVLNVYEYSYLLLSFQRHPGTEIYNTPRYAGWTSLEPMWRQVEEIGEDVMAIGNAFPEGIHLLGYSQGGLLARAILQRYPQHNVRTFISLSSPQAGQYGSTIEF